MLPVEILPVQETVVLRARGSELLILPHHVKNLKGLTKAKDFSQYFRDEALVNRPARKLFEAWLRKDHTLWQRLYTTIHKQMNNTDSTVSAPTQVADPVAVSVPQEEPATSSAAPVESKPSNKKAKAAALKAADTANPPVEQESATAQPKKKTAVKKNSSTTTEAGPKKTAAASKKEKTKDETTKKAPTAKKSEPKAAPKASSKTKNKG